MSNTPNIPGEGTDPWTGQPADPATNPWQQPGQMGAPAGGDQYPGQQYPGQQYPGEQYPGHVAPGAPSPDFQNANYFAGAQGAPGYGHDAYAPAPVLASWGKRAQGFLLDWFLPSLVLNGLWTMFHKTPAVDPATTDPMAAYSVSSQAPSILFFLITALALSFLNKNGQTPGRRWAGTQLVDAQGHPVQAGGPSILRYLLHFLDDLCLLGWLWPLWDKKRQTFADKLASTQVIDLRASGRDPRQP